MKSYSKPKKCTHPRYSYYVKYTDAGGKRSTKFFKTLDEAQNFYEQGNIQVANAGFEVAGLPEADRRAYLDAQKLLTPYGISVLEAVKEYVDARQRLEPYKKSLSDCLKHFEKWNEIKEESTTLFKAYGQYLDDITAKNKSERYISSQKNRLNRFVREIGNNFIVGIITPAQCNKWLNSLVKIEQEKVEQGETANGQARKVITNLKVSNSTRNSYRRAISAFFSYCVMQGYIKANPIDKVSTSVVFTEETTYYTLNEVRKILYATEPLSDLRLFFAIGFFAGLRPIEIERLDFSDINLKNKTILLPARKTKTNKRRTVLINETLLAWLAPYAIQISKGGQIVLKNFRRRREAFIDSIGVKWLADGLRHSYGTYLYAYSSNKYETAKQMGNSPDVLERHYANLRVTKEEAKEFFNIFPQRENPITQFTDVLKSQTA